MPDWQQLVSHRLAALALDEREKQEVIAELADHLQETYEAVRRAGLSESDAVGRALLQVNNWDHLQRRISEAKEYPMNARTSRLWLPSFVTLALSVVTLVGFAFLGLQPGPFGSRPGREVWWGHLISGNTGGLAFVNEYTVWLMALPFLGALGAYLSGRAGGRRRDILISGVFPALAWFAIVLVVFSFAASLGHGVTTLIAPVGPVGLLALLVLIPGACLLLGVLAYSAAAKRRTKAAI